ncbi:MAG TPA: VOC family protein [Candidatus Saccharimonadales bacterium]|nr:VOC family protein [Candidatus Saccharimonadales bacterium]
MKFKKIDHINIVVQDLESAKKFFQDLGFEVLKQDRLSGDAIEKIVNLSGVKAEFVALAIPGTETNIELIKYENPQGNIDPQISMANQIGFRHIALEVKEIEKVVEELKSKGIKFFSDIQIYNVTKKLCYFLGPERIIIELAEYD